MLTEVDAIRYDKRMENGKTKPVLLACERNTGEVVELVAKFSQGCDNSCAGLICEALTAVLAHDLGLPTPRPYIVHASKEFVESVVDPSVRLHLQQSCAKGYGSERLPDGYSTWVATRQVSEELQDVMRQVLAFDVLVCNPDRRCKNPNLMFNGSQISMIDHELALRPGLELFWKAPWTNGAVQGLDDHPLYALSKGSVLGDFSDFEKKFREITDDKLTAYGQAIPKEWFEQIDTLSKAINYIRDIRQNISPAMVEITRALS